MTVRAAEDEIDEPGSQPSSARTSTESAPVAHPKRVNVWQDTFSPQMNSNMKRMSGKYYDSPDKGSTEKSVWEHIIKADHVKHAAFASFDVNSAPLAPSLPLRDIFPLTGFATSCCLLLKRSRSRSALRTDKVRFADDGLIDAEDLRARLGPDADVEKLIKQADRNGDGKIDQAEFTELLKNM